MLGRGTLLEQAAAVPRCTDAVACWWCERPVDPELWPCFPLGIFCDEACMNARELARQLWDSEPPDPDAPRKPKPRWPTCELVRRATPWLRLLDIAGFPRALLSGSVRRGRSTCGDLDVVVQDNGDHDLRRILGVSEDDEDHRAGSMGGAPTVRRFSVGYRVAPNLLLDVFTPSEFDFAAQLAFSTGSRGFNRKIEEIIVDAPGEKLDWWSAPHWHTYMHTHCPDLELVGPPGEEDRPWFELIGMPWIPPAERDLISSQHWRPEWVEVERVRRARADARETKACI